MNLEQIVKETVAKMVDEKTLTAAEKKKKEDIVMAMKKDFKGPEAALYAIATDKAKKLAEDGLNEDYEVAMAQDSLDSIIRAAMMLKAQMGDQEVNLPAWIQDHITNSENYIYQAAKGYHESTAQTGAEDQSMDEANLGHNETSSIEQEGRFWIVTYQTADGTKEKSFESEDEARAFYNTLDEAFVPKSSFDDYSIGDNVTINGKKAKITSMEMDDETGERRARVRFEDDSVEKVSINSLDEAQDISDNELAQLQATADDTSKMPAERDAARNKIYTSRNKNTMTTNEGRSAEDLKQAQLEKAYDHLEKMKANTRLFSKEDIKKAEERIDKLEAELDALAAKATNESLDEATVRRWQHYAGIK
jgi:hypothetical protein